MIYSPRERAINNMYPSAQHEGYIFIYTPRAEPEGYKYYLCLECEESKVYISDRAVWHYVTSLVLYLVFFVQSQSTTIVMMNEFQNNRTLENAI